MAPLAGAGFKVTLTPYSNRPFRQKARNRQSKVNVGALVG
jgi:hypothetical protein